MKKQKLIDKTEEVKNEEYFVIDKDITETEIQDRILETPEDEESYVVKNDISGSVLRENDNSKIFGIKQEHKLDNKISTGRFTNMLDEPDSDYIIERNGGEIIVKEIGESFDKETDMITEEKFSQYESFIDGSYPDEEITDIKSYLDEKNNITYTSKFEKRDREIKAEKMKQGADPRTLNDNEYAMVNYKDEVVITEQGKDDDLRLQKDTTSVPTGDGRKAIINTSKGRRTSLPGAPIAKMDADELMKKTGSDNINEAIHKFETADPDTLKETFGDDWDENKPDSYELWAKMMEEGTEINDYRRLPAMVKLSGAYNMDSNMDVSDIHNAKMTREEIFMTLSTHYVDDYETVEKMFEEIDENEDVTAEDIAKYLPDKIDDGDKQSVARQLLVNLREIDYAFDQQPTVEEGGTTKISVLDAPVIGTGYSVYPYVKVQTINGVTYVNGIYYQASYREGGVSKSDYIQTGGSFDYDIVPSNTES